MQALKLGRYDEAQRHLEFVRLASHRDAIAIPTLFAATGYETLIYDCMIGDNILFQRADGTPCGGGQTRSFTYDSLERLSSATNPEMEGNTLRYGYDENGNITSKSGSGSAALQVSLTYDALNRVKTRDYNDGTTPPVTYCYDGASWSGSFGGCNGFPAAPSKGHLT